MSGSRNMPNDKDATRKNLTSLPDEILLQVVDMLDSNSLGRLSRTCGRLYRFVTLDMIFQMEKEELQARFKDELRELGNGWRRGCLKLEHALENLGMQIDQDHRRMREITFHFQKDTATRPNLRIYAILSRLEEHHRQRRKAFIERRGRMAIRPYCQPLTLK